jgi:hypothetical protein
MPAAVHNPDGTVTTPNGRVIRPSPQAPTIYSGPEVPIVYDPLWQYFTNLTLAQIAAFQAMPEWAAFLAKVEADPIGASIPTPMPKES